MSVQWTVERILRDGDDPSGQTVRQWYITGDAGSVVIRKDEYSEHGERIHIRVEDVPMFVADLQDIARQANPEQDKEASR